MSQDKMKNIKDISYLFLSSSNDEDAGQNEQVKEMDHEVSHNQRSVCLIGEGRGFEDSFLVVNLALALARLGMRIAVVDIDPEMPCLNFLQGDRFDRQEFDDTNQVVVKGPLGVRLIAVNSNMLGKLSDSQRSNLVSRLSEIEETTDLMLVSVAQKNLRTVVESLGDLMNEFVVTVSPNQESMLSSYRMVKGVFGCNPLARIGMITISIDHMYQIEVVYNKMSGAVRKFLDKELYKYGFLFKVKPDNETANKIASFYDADLNACISNIAQIVLLRLNLETGGLGVSLFKRMIQESADRGKKR